jgi:signal transduction histidine kinase
MRVLLCDRGSVLADFQDVVRAAYPAFQVDIETDPYRAVERAHETRPEVIVTEIDLSGIAGVELIRRFRDAAPRAKVVVWTREDSADAALAALGAGGAGWLLKAEGDDRVLAAIDAAASGLISLSPDIADALSRREARARLHELELEDALALHAGELDGVTSAKAEFLSNISHELRTPVTVAKGISHIIAKRDVAQPERGRLLSQLDQSLDKLMGIVDGLLTIAESEGGSLSLEIESFDLVPAMEAIVDEVGARYPHVSIDRALPPALTTVADRARLGKVIRHLLDNACRYSPPSGTVQVMARAQAEGTVVSVTDHGEGILREVVARAFDEPFSTGEAILRKERAGAGLGLHMARRLIVEHGGVIWADPLPGGGTRVSFCIPAKDGDTLDAPPMVAEPGIAPRAPEVEAEVTSEVASEPAETA